MKIIVQKNLESAKVEIDTKDCSYQWGFRDAIILAMEIEGFHKSFIDQVFNQEEIRIVSEAMSNEDCNMPSN